MKKRLLAGALIISMLIMFLPARLSAAGTLPVNFVQGTGYQTGKYDLSAPQPTAFNWTRQSRFNGPAEGDIKWRFSQGIKDQGSSSSIGSDGTIYVGSSAGKLYAINPDGSEKWSFSTGDNIESSPSIGADGTIYTGSDDGKLYAVNPDGSEKWDFPAAGEIKSSPAIGADGTIYIGSDDKKLYAVNPDGSEKWSFRAGGEIEDSPVIGSDGTIYTGAYNGKLYAINPDGSAKGGNWPLNLGSAIIASPVIAPDGTIYAGGCEGKLYAISSDGSSKGGNWPLNLGSAVMSSPAIGSDGTIYAADAYELNAINSDGKIKWKFSSTASVIDYSPIIGADGTIYMGVQEARPDDSQYGSLCAINSDGSERWHININNMKSSPSIGSDGTIYISSDDGKLYAVCSSKAGILTVLNKTTETGAGAGSQADPKQISISIDNSVSGIKASDIKASFSNASVSFYGTDDTFCKEETGCVNLQVGNTNVYTKITASSGTNAEYYKVAINRAAAPDSADIKEVTDLKTNFDARDLQIKFSAADESKISKYRIMAVPFSETAKFDLSAANSVLPGNYTEAAKAGKAVYTVALAAGAKDVDGNLIETDKAYKVYILSVVDGTNANTLSTASDEIILQKQLTIKSISALPIINASACMMKSGNIELPEAVEVTLNNNATINAAVTWDKGNPVYDGKTAGEYTFTGTIANPKGVANPDNKTASVKVESANPPITYGAYVSATLLVAAPPSTNYMVISNSGDFNADASNKGSDYDGRTIPYTVVPGKSYMEIDNWKLASGNWISDNNWDTNSNIRTVYLKYIDSALNVSQTYYESIYTVPSYGINALQINGGAAYTNTTSTEINLPPDYNAGYSGQITFSGDIIGSPINQKNYNDNLEPKIKLTSGDGIKNIQINVEADTTSSGILHIIRNFSVILDQTSPEISNLKAVQKPDGAAVSGDFSDGTSGICKKLYASGVHDVSYFSGGNGTQFDSDFTVNEKGTYTICAEDNAGNYAVKTIAITAPSEPVITGVTDLKVNYDASDLQVKFTGADETNIKEYRIMAVPFSEASKFDLGAADNVSAGNYTAVSKTGSSSYTQVLAAGAKDSDGNPIVTGKAYKIFVLAVADGTNAVVNALSAASEDITLQGMPFITSVSALSDINVANGTSLSDIGLPETVSISVSNGSMVNAGVAWDGGSPAYSGNEAGEYIFTGKITNPSGVINPDNIKASVKVIVEESPKYAISYNGNGNTSGSVPVDSNNYYEGDSVTVSDNTGNLAKSGYAFAGWNTQPDGKGTNYIPGASFHMGNSNIILYAIWTKVQGYVVDEKGQEIQGIDIKVITEANGNKDIEANSEDVVLIKQADGTMVPLSNISSLVFGINSGAGISISNDGKIEIKNLVNGTEYKATIAYNLGNDQKIVIGHMNIRIDKNGDITFTSTLIDPYGRITDAASGKSISGAEVTLYYADTARNRAAGRMPGTMVQLPSINEFKTNGNRNSQLSDRFGAYGFMVFPQADYYIMASKDGYNKYISSIISVDNELVKQDIRMIRVQNAVLVKSGSVVNMDMLDIAGALSILAGIFLIRKKKI